MAWLETCRIDANKQIEHLKNRGKSVREALKILSEESGIPIGTLNNWIYERKRSKPIEIFDFVLGDMWKDLHRKDPKKWKKLINSATFRGHNLMLWLWLETEYVFNWYRAAFDHYGKSARIMDGWRVGYIKCDCPKCNGKIHRRKQFHNKHGEDFNYSPELMRVLSKQGYVNFNAI